MHVKAISSFTHGRDRRRGDVFEVSEKIGQALKEKGLAEIVSSPVPAPEQTAPSDPAPGGSSLTSGRATSRRSAARQD